MQCKGKVCKPNEQPIKHKRQGVFAVQCRRCGREIPIGQRKTCPFCGIYLDTYITPRDTSAKTAKKNRRTTVLSFLSVAFVVVVVAVLIPFLRNVNKRGLRADLDAMYGDLTENRYTAKYTEDEWEQQLNVYAAKIASFKKSYPSDEELFEELDANMQSLLEPDPAAEKMINDALAATARDNYIDILSVSVNSGAGDSNTIAFKVKNCSDRSLARVEMAFAAFDADGNPVANRQAGVAEQDPVNTGYMLPSPPPHPGEESQYLFVARNVWGISGVAEVKLLWMNITYTRGDSVFFPPEVCERLWR